MHIAGESMAEISIRDYHLWKLIFHVFRLGKSGS